jgi:hypothetical protein
LVGEVEEETVAEATRATVNKQLDFLSLETKNILDGMHTTISKQVEKRWSSVSLAVTKTLEDKTNRTLSYWDVVLNNAVIPPGTNMRVLAWEGIRSCQFILDIWGDSLFQDLGQAEVLVYLNEAMDKTPRELEESDRKIRLVI